MTYSLHARWVYRGIEDIKDFKLALEAEKDRKEGLNLPPDLKIHPERLLYREIGRYSDQVARYFDAFGRDRVHIIIFDDMKADTKTVYLNTLKFLELDTGYIPEFKAFNPNKEVRSQAVLRLVYSPPTWGVRVARTMLPLEIRRGIGNWLTRINTRPVKRAPMDQELRRDLQRKFVPEIEELSALIGRDLTHWSS